MFNKLFRAIMVGVVVQVTLPHAWAVNPQDQKRQGRPSEMSESINSSAAQMIGSKLIVGFKGIAPQDPGVQEVAKLAQEGKIGGVIFFAYNLENPEQIKKLTNFFANLKAPKPLFLAIDQEGGKVQRLKPANGFSQFPSAKEVGEMDDAQVYEVYKAMAQELEDAGFNLVLGPVVDLEYDQQDPEKTVSPAIGKYERSFSAVPKTVVRCAEIFINAMHEKGIFTALKHFPGHGLAQKDSHQGFVDVTHTHKDLELEPFLALGDKSDMIMTAHLTHQGWDKDHPFTLSKKSVQKRLREPGYEGVIISDCLNMGAIAQHYNLHDAVRLAINASVDLVIISNNDGSGINKGKQSVEPSKIKPFKDQVEELNAQLLQDVEMGKVKHDDLRDSQIRIDMLWHNQK